jgi:hypothetical protein
MEVAEGAVETSSSATPPDDSLYIPFRVKNSYDLNGTAIGTVNNHEAGEFCDNPESDR